MLSEIYWSFFTTSIISFLIVVIRFGYKSKCEKVECCCIKITRNTTNEIEVDEMEMQRQKSSKDEKDNAT